MSDPDGDGLDNIDEYYNNWDDNVSDPCSNVKPKRGRPGIGFFGDGDGSLSVSGGDLDTIVAALSGNPPSYYQVYPSDFLVQDLDGNGVPSGGDLDLLVGMLSGNAVVAPGWPTDPDPGASFAVQSLGQGGQHGGDPGAADQSRPRAARASGWCSA